MKLESLYKSEKPVPIICDSFINTLGLVRSFGEEGINSIVIDFKKGIATASKYASWIKSPHPKEEESFILFLIALGKKLRTKGFILVTNDIWLLPIARNKKRLEKYFIVPMSNWDIVNNALNKTFLYDFAKRYHISHPKTCIIKNLDIDYDKLKGLRYPIILKPSMTTDFTGVVEEPRNTIVKDEKDLKRWLESIRKYQFKNIEIIAQEYIPGGIETLYTITSYTDMNGQLKAFSIGHKIRQYPLNAGTITSGKVIYNELLYNTAKDFFQKFKFHGIANTEFKYDERDNSFKLIEINARPGKWNYSACATGINLPLIAYKDLIFNDTSDGILFNKKELIWIDGLNDYIAYIKINHKYFWSIKNLISWWKSFDDKSNKVYAIFNIHDMKPFFYSFGIKIQNRLKRIFL